MPIPSFVGDFTEVFGRVVSGLEAAELRMWEGVCGSEPSSSFGFWVLRSDCSARGASLTQKCSKMLSEHAAAAHLVTWYGDVKGRGTETQAQGLIP